MAWYEMEYRCGHSERVQLYGKGTERERTLEWAKENKDCPDCYKDRMVKEREAQNERAAKLAQEIGFSQLSGSDKQIAWANSLRQKVYEDACKMCKAGMDYSPIASSINLETSAQWWIEKRNNNTIDILKMIAASYPAKWAEIQKKAEEIKNAKTI